MRIAVICNDATLSTAGRPNELASDREMTIIPELVIGALSANGHAVKRFEATLQLGQDCRSWKADLALNLAEGFDGTNANEHLVPCLLDLAGIPYTGADAANMLILRNKYVTSRAMANLGVQCPKSELCAGTVRKAGISLRFPIILKPVNEEASHGIHLDSVVTNEATLAAKLSELNRTGHRTILAEEFIVGREVSVGVWGNEDVAILPPVEFHFPDASPLQAFRSFEYKWLGKQEDMRSVDNLPEPTRQRLNHAATFAHRIFLCRDYSRADFRIDADGTPYFLEHNFNPGIGPNTHGLSNTFTRMTELAGVTYSEMIERILLLAARRSALP